jgi:hypothetical protein
MPSPGDHETVMPGAKALKTWANASTSASKGAWPLEGHMQSILMKSIFCSRYQLASDAYQAVAAAEGALVPSVSASQLQLWAKLAASRRVYPGTPAIGRFSATPATGTPRMNHAPNLSPLACTCAARAFRLLEPAEDGKREASGMGSPFPLNKLTRVPLGSLPPFHPPSTTTVSKPKGSRCAATKSAAARMLASVTSLAYASQEFHARSGREEDVHGAAETAATAAEMKKVTARIQTGACTSAGSIKFKFPSLL